jgi:hypothetical protein
MCTCAPFIDQNITRAHQLGMTTLGCCGDSNHTYGFHVPANRLPADDYSIVHSGPPVDRSQALAGDFSMNTPWSRKWLAWFVDQVKAGKMPGVVEIIGSLNGSDVLYWAAWHGWASRRYNGQGHKTWAHISGDRAKGNDRTDFFAGFDPNGSNPPVSNPPGYAPPFPGRLIRLKRPQMRGSDVLQWQKRMHYRGWRIDCDGVFGPQSQAKLIQFQKEKKLTVDGILGPQSWAAAWTTKITK